MNECLIYDFETLSQEPTDGVVLTLAALSFSEKRYLSDEPYEYDDLIASCGFIKFDVKEQVEVFGRKISKTTLQWWSEQGKEAQKYLKPSEDDVSIKKLKSFLTHHGDPQVIKKIFTRGNMFDPMFVQSLFKNTGDKDPYPFWTIRDTRSTIEGMGFGFIKDNSFIPKGLKEKFIAHDPRHDIVMDVMRMQFLGRLITGKGEE